MKRLYFAATCVSVAMSAGFISLRWEIGVTVAFSLWWLLMSLDAMFNPVREVSRAPAVPGDCELEL